MNAGSDLSVEGPGPWAGSLLEAPTHPQIIKCYNLHALTIVIITKYIYIYFYRKDTRPVKTAQFAFAPPPKSGPG